MKSLVEIFRKVVSDPNIDVTKLNVSDVRFALVRTMLDSDLVLRRRVRSYLKRRSV
jgi:hypothetical protein